VSEVPTVSLREVRTQEGGQDADAWERLQGLAVTMEREGRGRDDPVREVFGLLGDRWTMLILLALGAGPWRHATLRRIIGALAIEGGISQRMLTLKLRALERDGFVLRESTADVPPRVTYRLSAIGEALLAQAERLLAWVGASRHLIEQNRRDFDSRDRE
jgi:DNA-binding HxlR family transcriptional regulator